MKFVSELRRRNVFRVGAAYVIVAWLLMQAADILLGNFGAPPWVFQSFAVLLVLGFPIALFMAWALELTPEGIRPTDMSDEAVSPARRRKSLDGVIIAGLVLIIGVLLVDRFWLSARDGDDEPRVIAAAESGDEPPPLPETAAEPSVAVLPFASLSADPEDSYFAIGVQEDVLTFLSRLSGIRVISRTSVEQFAESRPSIPEIAELLQVSHILEGSVRRAGDRVRVTVQLIETDSDRHLWAEHYDRDLADVFAIQTEIAQAVAGQLKQQLEPEQERRLVAPDTRPEVYELYLRIRANRWRMIGLDATRQRVAEIERIIELDPEYAPLWFELLEACALLVFNSFLLEPHCEAQVERAIARLDELNVDPLDLQLAEGVRRYYVERDLAGAQALFAGVATQRPNDIDALHYQAFVARRLGQWDHAIEIMEAVLELDPLNSQPWAILALAHRDAGRYEESIDIYAEAVRRFPDVERFAYNHADAIYRHTGDLTRLRALAPGLSPQMRASAATLALTDGVFDTTDEALAWLDGAASDDVYLAARIEWTAGVRLIVDRHFDDGLEILRPITERAEQVVDTFENDFQPEARSLLVNISLTFALVGDFEKAREYRERSLARLTDIHDEMVVISARSTVAMVDGLLGDPEAIWPEFEARMRQLGGGETEWTIVNNLLMRHIFGETTGYQALLDRLAAS